MTAKKQQMPAPVRLIACAALVLSPMLGAAHSVAAETRVNLSPPFALPAPVIGGETRIPAARPFGSSAAHANYYAAPNADVTAPEGRLRLRPMHLGGM